MVEDELSSLMIGGDNGTNHSSSGCWITTCCILNKADCICSDSNPIQRTTATQQILEREALRMKFATQRKLASERFELGFENQVMPFLSLFRLLLHLDAQAAMALCTSCHFSLICEYTHILSLSTLICVGDAIKTDMCSKLTPL